MRVAIMQPYIFPYWPYVQLMSSVDLFVLLDTVQYIDQGWINRNRICVAGEPHLISFPVRKRGRMMPISEIRFSDKLPRALTKTRKTLAQAYGRRPFGDAALEMFDATFADLSSLDAVSIIKRCLDGLRERLSLRCSFELASNLGPRTRSDAQGYIIQLVGDVGARTYINPIGGRELYDRNAFQAAGKELLFLRSRPESYDQGYPSFVPDLSSLDLLANLRPTELQERLPAFDLI
jgi:hypothetical protein